MSEWHRPFLRHRGVTALAAALVIVVAASEQTSVSLRALAQAPTPAAAEQLRARIGKLRSLADDIRATETRNLALEIRSLPPDTTRLGLALSLSRLSTEGDFGRQTLQEVTTTLATSVRDRPASAPADEVASAAYEELAQLARYERMTVNLDLPAYRAALVELDRLNTLRATADFTLRDLDGRTWTRSSLTGRVVLVNFWATWCPPCRKEMPDLDALSREFASDGLVILAISDEPEATVKTFLTEHPVGYHMLIDPGRKVSDALKIEGIPKTFVYDRSGHMVAQSIDMRTRPQFLAMLRTAGLAR
jgi:peroxiredoxin